MSLAMWRDGRWLFSWGGYPDNHLAELLSPLGHMADLTGAEISLSVWGATVGPESSDVLPGMEGFVVAPRHVVCLSLRFVTGSFSSLSFSPTRFGCAVPPSAIFVMFVRIHVAVT